jgi:DNA-binding NarL/FixJ family response regulator
MNVRVLLVEDHELVRSGIKTMLEKDPRVEVVGDAANGAEGVEMTRRLRPDIIVLMDIEMPVLNGIEATRQIVREVPETKVIMLTMHDAETHDLQALNAGAVGYVHKNTNPDDLLRAVHTVAKGDPYLSPQSTRRVLSKLQGAGSNGQRSTSSASLTEREKALLGYLARGLSGKEIARELSLSDARVRTVLSELYAKIGVNGKAQAAAYAVEHKLI